MVTSCRNPNQNSRRAAHCPLINNIRSPGQSNKGQKSYMTTALASWYKKSPLPCNHSSRIPPNTVLLWWKTIHSHGDYARFLMQRCNPLLFDRLYFLGSFRILQSTLSTKEGMSPQQLLLVIHVITNEIKKLQTKEGECFKLQEM